MSAHRPLDRGPLGDRPRVVGSILLLLLVAAAGVRIAAATGDLWLDEIWSLRFALDAAGPLEILLGVNHDNNHWLNTLYLYAVGDTDHLYLYRLLAVATGVGLVLAVTLDGMERGARAAVTVCILFGFSYLLVRYGSEARGYGPAVFFGICSYLAIRRYLETRRIQAMVTFSLCASAALLSQLTFAWVLAGFIAWSVAAFLKEDRWDTGPPRGILPLLGLHLLPFLVLVFLLVFDVRFWTIGGSHPNPVGGALESLVRLSFGVPGPSWLVVILGVLLGVVILGEIVRMVRQRDPAAFFYGISVFVGPAVFVVAMDLPFFYPRYLLVSLPFALLLVARFFERVAATGRLGAVAWVLLLTGFLAGNLPQIHTLATEGRGEYRAAVEHILEASSPGDVRVGVASATAQGMVLDFYASRIDGGDRIRILSLADEALPGPDWIVVQDHTPGMPSPQVRMELRGLRFDFERRFGDSGVSGWTWDLHRAVDGEPHESRP